MYVKGGSYGVADMPKSTHRLSIAKTHVTSTIAGMASEMLGDYSFRSAQTPGFGTFFLNQSWSAMDTE